MTGSEATILTKREKFAQVGALAALLLLGGMALAGPSGALAWGENVSLLEQRRQTIASLEEQRDELRNRVKLLDPSKVDADLAGELVRRNLNVVHEDEVVITLD